jgi:hypothetical protein
VVQPRLERYLQDLVEQTEAALGEDLVGVYATGSLALGAFQEGRSDVDVAVVCRSELPAPVKSQLVGRLRHEALPCPARGLELVVYRRAAAMSGTAEPGFELELNTGPDMEFRVTWRPEDRPAEDGLFWYGLDRSLLHRSGLRLVGPPASDVFSDLAREAVDDLLVASLRWWIARPAPSEDAVLGACRALVKHRWDRWLGKVDAGLFLLDEGYEPADIIRDAVAARSGGPPLRGDAARRFQAQVLEEVAGSNAVDR